MPVTADADHTVDIRIGLFGSRNMIRAMADCAVTLRSGWPTVDFAPSGPPTAASRATRGSYDSIVLPGILSYDVLQQGGALSVPASYVAPSRTALHAGMVRARLRRPTLDLTRASIDTLTPDDVSSAYREVGLRADRLRCLPYSGPDSVEAFLDFHLNNLRHRGCTIAFTTHPPTQVELAARGLPALHLWPTTSVITDAINVAISLATRREQRRSQIVMIMVALACSDATPARLRDRSVDLHGFLLREGRTAGVSIQQTSEATFLVTTTPEGLHQLTAGLTRAPFAAAAAATGAVVAVGIGVGTAARAAQVCADGALAEAVRTSAPGAVYRDDRGVVFDLPTTGSPEQPAPPERAVTDAVPERLARIVDTVAPALPADAHGVVDASVVAAALRVTERTARRMLAELADAGLATPVPSLRRGDGRPRRRYRLLPLHVAALSGRGEVSDDGRDRVSDAALAATRRSP